MSHPAPVERTPFDPNTETLPTISVPSFFPINSGAGSQIWLVKILTSPDDKYRHPVSSIKLEHGGKCCFRDFKTL